MRYILAACACLAVFIACRPGNNKLIDPSNLTTEQYVINIDRDTTLETKNAALLKIPKGSLATDKGNTVTLEIREAYSLQQMIQAGLTTQSNGDPLSSGGMIYINAAAGQQVTIKQKIRVAIPSDFLQRGMQLFEGNEQVDGRVNWVNPDSLPANKQLTAVDQGKVLFEQNCASCHAIGRDMDGPDLAHLMKRFPIKEESDNLYYRHGNYFYTPAFTVISGDLSVDTSNLRYFYDHYEAYNIYKCNLRSMYLATGPNLNTDSSQIDLSAIYRYIQNESDQRNLPFPAHAWLKDCADSCAVYRKKINDLLSQKTTAETKKQQLKEDNGPLVDKKPDSTWLAGNVLPPPDFDQRVSPKNYDATYYQFTIDSFGWFNIDMMLKNVNGVEESELFVRVMGQYRERIKVYLVIPSVKVYGEGGPAERNPDEFAFFYKNGKLPLPQNEKAYILAVTENETSIAFGLKEFTTTTKQELSIELHAATKEEFTTAMQQFELNRLHIKVNDAKNAAEIRKTDTDLKNIDQQLKDAEQLKPKNCRCDCGDASIINMPAIDSAKVNTK